MIEFNKVFIDTAPLIYYLEQNPQYYEKSKEFIRECCEYDTPIVTSAITVKEYCVFPFRNKKLELIRNFDEFINDMEIDTARRADNKKRRYAPRKGGSVSPFLVGVSKGGNAPFCTRLCRAKCSVLYALSAADRAYMEPPAYVMLLASGQLVPK